MGDRSTFVVTMVNKHDPKVDRELLKKQRPIGSLGYNPDDPIYQVVISAMCKSR